MHRITFFTKPDCSLCRAALYVVERVRTGVNFDLEIVDILEPKNKQWFDAYRHDIPVVHLNGHEIFRHRVDERRLREIVASPAC